MNYSYKWTQPYTIVVNTLVLPVDNTQEIEAKLASGNFAEANDIIRRIQNASKSN